jgi:signal transduction histidine kinase
VRRVLAHAIVLAGLAALVAAAFAAVVLALGRPPTGSEWGLLALSAVAAAGCALLWVPLHRRLRVFATRLAGDHRSRDADALRAFSSRLTRAVPLDELLLQLAETLRRALALDAAEVWTNADGLLERVASDPYSAGGRLSLTATEQSLVARAGVSGDAWIGVWLPGLKRDGTLRVAPITNGGDLLGLILVERHAGQSFNDADDGLLADLARQLGLTLRNVHLDSELRASLDELRRQADELRASRARVVSAADAERRRIERDIHDGAQQQLVGLVVNLRLAAELVDSDVAEARAVLESTGRDAKQAIAQIRELAQGIYPPLLLDRGCAEALRAAARHAPTPVRVEANGAGRYAPEVEATVYFCCLEALQNTAKHGGAGARATVRLWEEEGALRFDVSDTGGGFDADRTGDGAGLANMRDRLGALGGRHALRSDTSGTAVSGTIPLARPGRAAPP